MNVSQLAELACLMAARSIEKAEITTRGARYLLVILAEKPAFAEFPISGKEGGNFITAPYPSRFRLRHPGRGRDEIGIRDDVSNRISGS